MHWWVVGLSVATVLVLVWMWHNRTGPEWYRLDDKER